MISVSAVIQEAETFGTQVTSFLLFVKEDVANEV